jgi:hypothetical protein
MSQENVERLRAGFESFLAGRSDFGVELLDPEVEWDATDSGVPDLAAVGSRCRSGSTRTSTRSGMA